MTDTSQPQSIYQLVTVGGVAVGWINRFTGAYTPAVRVTPPGQPIGSLPRPLSRYWGD